MSSIFQIGKSVYFVADLSVMNVVMQSPLAYVSSIAPITYIYRVYLITVVEIMKYSLRD